MRRLKIQEKFRQKCEQRSLNASSVIVLIALIMGFWHGVAVANMQKWRFEMNMVSDRNATAIKKYFNNTGKFKKNIDERIKWNRPEHQRTHSFFCAIKDDVLSIRGKERMGDTLRCITHWIIQSELMSITPSRKSQHDYIYSKMLPDCWLP